MKDILKGILQGLLTAFVLLTLCFWIGLRYGDVLFGSWVPSVIAFMKAHP